MLTSQGELSKARSLFEDVIEKRRHILGPSHPDTLWTMNRFGWMLGQQGEFDEAHAMYEQILELHSRTLGPQHADTLSAASDVARALTRLGKFEEAHRLAEETLAQQRREDGVEQVDVLNTQSTLAAALQGLGQTSEARALMEEVVRLGEGSEHFACDRAGWMRGLAWTITLTETASAEDRERAHELAAAAIELRPQENESWRVRGAAYAVSGHWKESLAAFEKAIELGFRRGLLPPSILHRIDEPENRSDEDFGRLMNLVGRNAPKPPSKASE